jgi:single-stranded-DNA-specific exonuclease
LAASPLPGLKALQQLAGLGDQPLDAEAVAFKLAPRINAVGRLGDPLLVVDLLTTEDPDRAMDLAMRCEALNRQRRELCDAIEAEALALLEADGPHWPGFLLLAQGHWHHGVIGIVAARLVERCGRPVALLAGEGGGQLRASVRAPRGFRVDGALSACADLLERFGGHPAAGGFTVQAAKVRELKERLEALAQEWLGEQGRGRKAKTAGTFRDRPWGAYLLEPPLSDFQLQAVAGRSSRAATLAGIPSAAGDGLALGGSGVADGSCGCGLSPAPGPLAGRTKAST